MAGKEELRVSGTASLADGETRTFPLQFLGRDAEGFVLRHEGALYAYLNECPHWSVELDLGDGHFFDPAIGRIYCKNHGALFHPENGVCETGPCLGRSLVRFLVRAQGDDAFVGERTPPNGSLP